MALPPNLNHDKLGGCVPTLVEKEKWRNLLLTKAVRRKRGAGGVRHGEH